MTQAENAVALSARVRLARNYHDLPFSNLNNPQNAQVCVDRVRAAFAAEHPASRYRFYMLREMPKLEQYELMESHLISRDLLQNGDIGAALVREDDQLSIMINEEDHLRIQAMRKGLNLQAAAEIAFASEEKLANQCDFSFDTQLGYLTACPTNTGTGMRASVMLHLPMLTRCKQMGNVTQSVAKLGLTIRGLYGEGSEALGDLYQVSNQVTLGRTEEDILQAVQAVGKQLMDMELGLRVHGDQDDHLALCDQVLRSCGIMRYALKMDSKELMQRWSDVRLGAAMGLVNVPLEIMDELLSQAQDAHVKHYKHQTGKTISTEQARCQILKAKLCNTPQEE